MVVGAEITYMTEAVAEEEMAVVEEDVMAILIDHITPGMVFTP